MHGRKPRAERSRKRRRRKRLAFLKGGVDAGSNRGFAGQQDEGQIPALVSLHFQPPSPHPYNGDDSVCLLGTGHTCGSADAEGRAEGGGRCKGEAYGLETLRRRNHKIWLEGTSMVFQNCIIFIEHLLYARYCTCFTIQ